MRKGSKWRIFFFADWYSGANAAPPSPEIILDEMLMRHALFLQQPLTKKARGDRGMSGARTRIFVSYSSADVSWLERLQVHLKPLERAGLIEWWAYTRDLLAGQVWEDEIKKALAAAHIGVLLVLHPS